MTEQPGIGRFVPSQSTIRQVWECHIETGSTQRDAAEFRAFQQLNSNAGGNKDESGEHDSAPVWPEKQEPYTVADLSPEDQQLPGWKLVRKLHAAAVAAGRDQYVDPPSGYTVFTARSGPLYPPICSIGHCSETACAYDCASDHMKFG